MPRNLAVFSSGRAPHSPLPVGDFAALIDGGRLLVPAALHALLLEHDLHRSLDLLAYAETSPAEFAAALDWEPADVAQAARALRAILRLPNESQAVFAEPATAMPPTD